MTLPSDTSYLPPDAPDEGESVLDAPHLAEAETQPQLPPPIDLPTAVDYLRRIAYHRKRMAQVDEQVERMIVPLLAEIERIKAWGEQQKEYPQERIRQYEASLRVFYSLNKPTGRSKTINLPNGKLSMRSQSPEWQRDDAALLQWAQTSAADFVEHRPTLKWGDLKRKLTIRDDGTAVYEGTGEVVPGVRAVPRPDEFNVEVE